MMALLDSLYALITSIAIGNTDMHLKKWSVIYRDGRTPALAPVYDYVCTSIYEIDGRNELALKLGTTRRFSQIDRDTFDNFARRADLSSHVVTIAAKTMCDRILDTWATYRQKLEHLPAVRSRIDELLGTVPLFHKKTVVATTEPSDAAHEELA